jgi:hypothetical protein
MPQHPYKVFKVIPEAHPSKGCSNLSTEKLEKSVERHLSQVSKRNREQIPPEIHRKFAQKGPCRA